MDVQWYKGMLKSLTFFLDSQFVYNHVLVGGRNHVTRSFWNDDDEFLTSEEELSEHDAEDQDDESCIDVSGRQNFVAWANLKWKLSKIQSVQKGHKHFLENLKIYFTKKTRQKSLVIIKTNFEF